MDPNTQSAVPTINGAVAAQDPNAALPNNNATAPAAGPNAVQPAHANNNPAVAAPAPIAAPPANNNLAVAAAPPPPPPPAAAAAAAAAAAPAKTQNDEEKAKEVAEKKKQAMNDAADQFGAILQKFKGNSKAVQQFFAAYGTDGFAPSKPKDKTKDIEDKTAKGIASASDRLDDFDPSFKDRSGQELGLPSAPKGFGATYLTQDWAMRAIRDPDQPAMLDQTRWRFLVQSNNMLHGFQILSNGSLIRARRPAFQLKPVGTAWRDPSASLVPLTSGSLNMTSMPNSTSTIVPSAAPAATTTTTTVTTTSGGSAGPSAVPPPQVSAGAMTTENFIPDFEVYDASSIAIKETNNELEKSMVENGFSSLAVSASASGGYMGYAVAVSAGYSQEKATAQNKGDFKSRKEYTATYSFPRARVFLDEYNMDLTVDCKAFCSQVVNAWKVLIAPDSLPLVTPAILAPDADAAQWKSDPVLAKILARPATDFTGVFAVSDKFVARFGQIFATSFQLGGQLTATRSASSDAEVSDAQQRDQMKWAAAASFGSPYGGASASVGQEKNSSSKTHSSSVDNTSTLGWSARGGNTLLSANPPEWANSVGDFKTWRTIEQAEPVFLPSLINKLGQADGATADGTLYADVEKCFTILSVVRTQLAKDQKAAETLSNDLAAEDGLWHGRFKLQPLDGRKIVLRGQQLTLSASNEDEVIFSVLDGNVNNKNTVPTLDMLKSDWPLFLVANDRKPLRESADKGAQISGCYVDDLGNFTAQLSSESHVCRWSLRKQGWGPRGELIRGMGADAAGKFSRIPSALNVDALPDLRRKWNPNYPGANISNGDVVFLFSHADDSGAYRDPEEPPFWASAMTTKEGDTSLRAKRLSFHSLYQDQPGTDLFKQEKSAALRLPDAAVTDLMDKYHRNTLSQRDKESVDDRKNLMGLFEPSNWKNNIASLADNPDDANDFGDNEQDFDPFYHIDFATYLQDDGLIHWADGNNMWGLGTHGGPRGTCLRERLYAKFLINWWKEVQQSEQWKATPFKVVFLK